MNQKKALAEKVIEQIKKENKKMDSARIVFMKRFLLWSFVLIFSLLGALALSIIFYALSDFFHEARLLQRSFFYLGTLISFPILWISLFSLFIYMGVKRYRHSPRGYRINTSRLLIAYLTLLLLSAGTLNYFKVSQIIDEKLSEYLPFYKSWQERKEAVWLQPDLGLLSGMVIRHTETKLQLEDRSKKVWLVDFSQAEIRHTMEVRVGSRIKLIGERKGESLFNALELRPWQRKGHHPENINRKKCGQLHELGSQELLNCIKTQPLKNKQ